MEIRSKLPTLFKARVENSDLLKASQKTKIEAGISFSIAKIYPARFKHHKVVLKTPFNGFSEAYIFAPHWELPQGRSVKLDVDYYKQTDNSEVYHGSGSRQCNLTSNAMLAQYLLKKFGKKTLADLANAEGMREPESYYGQILDRYGDTTSHEANTLALRELGIESYFTTTLDIPEAVESIEAGYPVVVGVEYKASGHIMVMVGFDLDRGIYYFHDPYGRRAGSADWYPEPGVGGEYDTYSQQTLEDIWGSNGWGRIVTAVGGISTKLPTNW